MSNDFESLPRRIFVDSSMLQAFRDYGGFVFENVEPDDQDRIYSIPGGREELNALRGIFFVGKRAPFELALSRNSLVEVAGKNDCEYLAWAYEMLQYWENCLAAYERNPFQGIGKSRAAALDGQRFGYLSSKDRRLLQDALSLECDAFLTLDRKLTKNQEHLYKSTSLRVLLPSQLWEMLKPWAGLFV